MFGLSAAISFVTDIYEQIRNLDKQYLLHPECRHLPTRDHRYRNIIQASYLIIYRNTETIVEVLRILHGHSSIRKIKTVRSVNAVG
jgi:plasmid stabilization system protein ParE